ncbi:bromodomain-containing protein 8 isoform X2 [Thrips palmi]|nr:bromodomain-containing protein 8 isoform X2 [Thrips palmi]
MSVSRSLRGFGGEPGRPADWFSQKSCAVQYDNLLTQIETPKRKKRGADGSKAEGVDLTPAEVIVKQLTGERIEELRKLMAEARAVYMRDKEDLCLVQNGQADDRLQDLILQIQEEKKQEEAKQEEQQRYLRQREERKQEMEMAWRPHAAQQHTRGAGSQAARRPSNQSELGSETDNLESPSEQPTTTEEVVEPKPVSTPTSPLLTSLLKSPSPVTGVQSSSILHSAITSQRGASPTITSLLNSSPGVPSSTTSIPSSPNIKSLVSNALAGHDDVPKPQPHSTSSSPTLSMLLELPPSTPGKLPELPPYSATSATKQPVRPVSTPTSKPGDEVEEPTVELLLVGAEPLQQCQPAAQPLLEVETPKSLNLNELSKEPIQGPTPSEECPPSVEFLLGIESHDSLEMSSPVIESLLETNDKPEAENHTDFEKCKLAVETHCEVEYSQSDMPSEPTTGPLLNMVTSKFVELNTNSELKSEVEEPATPVQVQPLSSQDEESLELIRKEVSEKTLPTNLLSDIGALELTETCNTNVSLEVAAPDKEKAQDSLQSVPLNEFTDVSLQVTSNETDQQGISSEISSPQDVEPADKIVATALSEALDTLKKEPLPENVEIVLPEGTETRVPETESKVSLDAADLQQLSTDELEQYVVDPASIGVVLEELVPGLVDGDGVCLLNLEDADVSNMLEANETNEGTVAEPVTDQVETNSNKDDEVPQGDVKEQIEPVSVMHTSPAHQSPQRAIATPQSAAPSPRIAGRPSKGNMVARNIVMEQEELAKPSTVQSNSPQVVGDTETLSREDLENASIVFMQDGMLVQGGVVMQDDLVMNLNESRQTASIVNDIQVLQDAPNSSVVVIPHEDVASEKEVDITQAVLPSSVCESVSVAVESDKCVTPKKDDQKVENRSPSKTPLKSSEVSPIKKIADDTKVKSDSPAAKLSKLPANEVEKTDTPELQEVSKTAAPAPSIQENAKENVAEVTEVESTKKPSPLSPREKLPKPKPVPPTKRDKSPVVSESSNEVASEDDSVKEEILDEPKNDSDLKIPVKKTEEEKKSSASKVQMEDENARDADADPPAVQIKEEKIRADTPSTEDDNTRDIEPPQPVKRGRGRYARESIASSDSVPNSPAATNVSADDEKDYRSWKKSIMLVYNRIAQHKNSSIFLKPITDDIAPEYSSMILRPFDLQTIKKNIENGRIRTTDEFQRDIMIMFNNAIMYNKSNSPVHIMAREMQEEGVMHLNEFKNTQLVLQTVGSEGGQLLSRRGTRTADKRDQDSDGISSRRSGSVTGLLGKRKRSMPDDRVTPKRRRDDD